MKKTVVIITSLCLVCMLVFMSPALAEQTAKRPFPQHTTYVEGSIKPSNRTQEELDAEVGEYYKKWKERYLYTVENSDPVQKLTHFNPEKAEWVEPQNTICRSEAQGYGMLTVAMMAGYDEHAKEDFDALFRFFKAHLSNINPNLMAWQQLILEDGKIESSSDADSATDGDMDIAYSLLIADNQWGSDGEINYRQEALNMIHAILESLVHPEDYFLLVGDWAKPENAQYGKLTRSSDFMLNHLRTFAKVDTENSESWMKVFNKTVEIINTQYKNWSPNTGLIADFLVKNEHDEFVPPEGHYLEDSMDGDYNYNACRDPWRLPIDYLLTGDKSVYEQLSTLNTWIQKATDGNPHNVKPGYYIRSGKEGEPIPERDWEDLSFVAPFAVSAMLDASNQEWLNTLWDAITKEFAFEDDYYFSNNVRMQVMLLVSGNWWMPE